MSSNLPPDDSSADFLSPSLESAEQPAVSRDEVIEAVLVDDRTPAPVYSATRPRQRRKWLPIVLFLVTCVSTYAAGCYHWDAAIFGAPVLSEVKQGEQYLDRTGKERVASEDGVSGWVSWSKGLRRNWRNGLIYMACVMAILLFHEMGHFLLTLRYKVPASFPFFIPVPFMITGTMGAVIGMDPYKANRKEVFDIGLAGPLAGLVLTIPLVIYGIKIAEPLPVHPQASGFGDPLLVKLLIPVLHDLDQVKQDYAEKHNDPAFLDQEFTFLVNPIYMAGWVGMLVTGLNMLPLSQLDGGHVSYAIFGRYSRWLGRGFLITAIAFIVLTESYNWTLMLVLVILIGTDHPPTADDTVKLGPWRWTLGLMSLAIPVFCFTPFPLIMGGQ